MPLEPDGPGRDAAIARAVAGFDDGVFLADLARRVAVPTESQAPARRPVLRQYLEAEIAPALKELGYDVDVHENPDPRGGPLLVARRIEDPERPTVLSYGHADVVHGLEGAWRDGRSPWVLEQAGDHLYGRGSADNKGQHSVLLAALAAVLAERGRLGFNSVWLVESSEEIGSPGLAEFCAAQRDRLAGDVLVASDGPRADPERPTLFGGGRGSLNFELRVRLRDGAHHSGNWGGLIANPGVLLAHAIAALVSAEGRILVPDLCPRAVPESVRRAVADIVVSGGADAPAIDPWWGEPGFAPAERLLTWNAFEVLAFVTGDPDHPVNAVPGEARATCQIRFTVDSDPARFLPAIREQLDRHGLTRVEVAPVERGAFTATRFDPDDPWVRFAAASLARTTGASPVLMPNIGGSLPNEVFAHLLGLTTLWIPHSYAGCRQHGPDEHARASILRQGLEIMTGLFWDLGTDAAAAARSAR